MSITIQHWIHPEARPVRARRTHNKVKTGCLTCKIRRKKCDEARPSCQRCLSTGRKCDGYAPPSPADSASPATSTSSTATTLKSEQRTTVVSSASFFGHSPVPHGIKIFAREPLTTDVELHSFTYFIHNTIPQFASYFHAATWRSDLVRSVLALFHPTLFAAAVALGAVHRRFSLGICPEAFVWCKHASDLQQKAVFGLQQLKQELGDRLDYSNGVIGLSDRDVLVTSELFLGLFQGFQDDYDASSIHINAGLRYLLRYERPLTLMHRERWHCQQAAKPRILCQLVHRLYCNALCIWGTPIKNLFPCDLDTGPELEIEVLPPIPYAFRDLEEARDYLFTQIDWNMHAPARAAVDSKQRTQVHTYHVERLTAWSTACNRTSPECRQTDVDSVRRSVLSLARSAAYLMFCVNLFTGEREQDWWGPQLPPLSNIDVGPLVESNDTESLAYAAKWLWTAVCEAWQHGLGTHLADVKNMVEKMLNEHIIFQLQEPTHVGKSSANNRSLANYLVDGTIPRSLQEGTKSVVPWSLLGVYGIAGQMSAMQERAIIEAIRHIIPPHVDNQWVDITCMSQGRRQVLLRYYTPDHLGSGLWWTQEWWTF